MIQPINERGKNKMLFKKRLKHNKERQELDEFLTFTIEKKKEQLTMLDERVERKTLDRKTGLTHATIKILDIYQESDIRMPVDILEELSYMRFTEEKDIFDYIENQRHFWTLENRKKPYRKVR